MRWWQRWGRWLAVGLLAAVAVGALVTMALDLAREGRLRDRGIEVVAEVVEVRNNRSATGYDTTVVTFETRDGERVRTTIATQVRPTLDVLDVRYDPADPSSAEAVEEPAPVWIEDLFIAVAFGCASVLLAYAPRLRRWRDRLAGESSAPSSPPVEGDPTS